MTSNTDFPYPINQTLEAQYNVSARRGDVADVAARWSKRSARVRSEGGAKIDMAYGAGEREKLDFFPANPNKITEAKKGTPLLLYIHGGYWQRGDKNMYSFISSAFLQRGVSVAIPNYSLTPSVQLHQISQQLRAAIRWCWYRSEDLGISKDDIFVMGHSAGGHLTAMMMATDWPSVDSALPVDLIKGGIPISGVFELEPLLYTTINEGPRMTIEEAHAQSPLFISPRTEAPSLVVVGGEETEAFLRQSDGYVDKFQSSTRTMQRYDVPMADHFDVLEPLADADSVLFENVLNLVFES